MAFRLVRGAPTLDANAQLGEAGAWGPTLVGLNSARFAPVLPVAGPPGWYVGNVPASGNMIPVPAALLAPRQTAATLSMARRPIGPVDQDTARGNALQRALAATLAQLQKQQGA